MNKLMRANKKIEKTVVNCYLRIEHGVVSAYKKIENSFVKAFLTPDGDSGMCEPKEER